MREELEALKAAYQNASPIVRIQAGKPALNLLALLEKIVSRLEDLECHAKK